MERLDRRAEFAERVARWSLRTQLRPTRVRLRHMARLWAVCNVDDSITFATALLDQPEEFQDLVIVHELVHLVIRDHGTHFHRILRLFVPDCERIARLAPGSPAGWKQIKGVQEMRGIFVSKARIACEISGHETADHFADVGKMVDLGSGSQREVDEQIADKICNLRDILGSPPKGWPLARKQAYFDWAREVVHGVRGDHPELEQRFDALYRQRPAG